MVDLSALPENITLAVGDRLELRLPSYSGSGNSWSATRFGGTDAARVQIQLPASAIPDPMPADGTTEPPPLALMPEMLVITGVTPGEAAWRLTLSRSFGPANTAAVHDFRITVLAARR
jgi:hypothetical protein